MVIAILVFVFCLLFVLSTRCRHGMPQLQKLNGWAYAHRGLHGNGIPENSISAFRLAKEHGFGVELDVHLLADGNLAVIHDASLLRTAGVDIRIETLNAKQLDHYFLEGTQEKIPTLQQVLTLFAGEAPLIIELKAENGNHSALCQITCTMLDTYNGVYCLESFDPRCIQWLKKNRPDIIRGQLTENYFKTKSKLPSALKLVLRHQMMNFLTLPDFVAYRFGDRKTLSNWLVRNIWKAQGVTWTIRNEEDFRAAKEEGWIPIFENFIP